MIAVLLSFFPADPFVGHRFGRKIFRAACCWNFEVSLLLKHMSDMTRGVIDTSDIVFFLSMTGFFMFLTYTVLESRRWRQ